MAEPENISVEPEFRPPEGPASYGWFGGILEGRVKDIPALEQVVGEINDLTPARAELEIDGGRFTVLLDDQTLPGAKLETARLDTLVHLLQQLAEASAEPRGVESTLRFTGVYQEEVAETLFAPFEGEIRCVSRVRPLQPADRDHAPPATRLPSAPALGKRRALIVAVLLLVVFGLLAWKNGLLDRILKASPTSILLDTGPFKGMLRVELESHWGNYRITIRRGAGYPERAEDVNRLTQNAGSAVERAAVTAVASGGTIYARLLDRNEKVTDAASARLSPLLSSPDGKVVVTLPGRMSAHAVNLALDRGDAEK